MGYKEQKRNPSHPPTNNKTTHRIITVLAILLSNGLFLRPPSIDPKYTSGGLFFFFKIQNSLERIIPSVWIIQFAFCLLFFWHENYNINTKSWIFYDIISRGVVQVSFCQYCLAILRIHERITFFHYFFYKDLVSLGWNSDTVTQKHTWIISILQVIGGLYGVFWQRFVLMSY